MGKTFHSNFGLPRKMKKSRPLAAELVSLRPDVIYTAWNRGAVAAANATTTIPIIVGPGGEETLTRLAGNLAHPTEM